MAWRDIVDQHVCQPVGWPLFDTIDDIMNAFDDLATLIRRERTFGYIDFGNRHEALLPCRYIGTLCLGLLCVKS